MSTHGAVGFHIDGMDDKIAYNHFDSYPSALGIRILNECKTIIFNPEKVKAIKLVGVTDKPTEQDIEVAQRYTLVNLSVSEQSLEDWYCLLYNAQGKLSLYYLVGIMPDDRNFLNGSLFCEWAYIINLSTNKLEVYHGFQTKRGKGRYIATVRKPRHWKPTDDGQNFYYPVGLVKEYDLNNLPNNDTFLKDLEPDDD